MPLIFFLLLAGGVSSVLGLNYWLDLVEWRTAVIAVALVAITASVNQSAKLWFRIVCNSVLIIGALAFGSLDERTRRSEAITAAEKRATQVAEERTKEYKQEIEELEEALAKASKEASTDEHAARESLSLAAVRRINKVRGY